VRWPAASLALWPARTASARRLLPRPVLCCASVPAAGATQAASQPPLMVTVLPKTLVIARLPRPRWIPLPLPRSARLRLRHLTRRLLRLLARSSWVLPCRSRARRPTLQHLVVSAALRPTGPPKKKSSFPPAYPAPTTQAAASSSTAAPLAQPAPNPAADQGNTGPEQLLFQLHVLSDDDLYKQLADLPVSHLARLYGITAEVVIDQLYAITNLAQLDIELPISQMASAAAPPPLGRYPDRCLGRLDPIPSGPRFPDRAAADALQASLSDPLSFARYK